MELHGLERKFGIRGITGSVPGGRRPAASLGTSVRNVTENGLPSVEEGQFDHATIQSCRYHPKLIVASTESAGASVCGSDTSLRRAFKVSTAAACFSESRLGEPGNVHANCEHTP
jgi:hypothetical protein